LNTANVANVVGVEGFEPPHAPRDFRFVRSERAPKRDTLFKLTSESQSISRIRRGSRRAVTPSWVLHPPTPTSFSERVAFELNGGRWGI
jgi:hypothetical protein